MEDTALKLNQPLLSVRRFAPLIPQLPPLRPEFKSGPLTNPGTVPFLWERTPGRPKQETKPQKQTFHRPVVAPKLPPGRYQKDKDKDIQSSTNNGKGEDIGIHRDTNVENSKKMEDDKSSHSEDSDGAAYVDALDTLSRSESFFLNCSTSELDNLDSKPSGRFSMDAHTQELMMDRFIPAAKAAVSEMPCYPPKTHHVAEERPQQIKQTDQFKPSLRYGPSFTMRYAHDLNNEVEEEDSDSDSDDDYNRPEYSTRACGLLSQFCLKSSFYQRNPIPAISMRTRGPVSSSSKVRSRSSSASSFYDIIDKTRSNKTYTQSTFKAQSGSYGTSIDHDFSRLTEETEASSIHEEQINARIKGLGLLGIKTFQQLIADGKESRSGSESGSGGSYIEKILYVGTESPNKKEMVDGVVGGEEKSVPNVEELSLSASIISDNNCSQYEDICSISATAKCNPENKTIGSVEFNQNHPQFPCPPPLPKSPADSWLSRTISAKNPQKQGFKMPRGDTKWEHIVKNAKVRQCNLHYTLG